MHLHVVDGDADRHGSADASIPGFVDAATHDRFRRSILVDEPRHASVVAPRRYMLPAEHFAAYHEHSRAPRQPAVGQHVRERLEMSLGYLDDDIVFAGA